MTNMVEKLKNETWTFTGRVKDFSIFTLDNLYKNLDINGGRSASQYRELMTGTNVIVSVDSINGNSAPSYCMSMSVRHDNVSTILSIDYSSFSNDKNMSEYVAEKVMKTFSNGSQVITKRKPKAGKYDNSMTVGEAAGITKV